MFDLIMFDFHCFTLLKYPTHGSKPPSCVFLLVSRDSINYQPLCVQPWRHIRMPCMLQVAEIEKQLEAKEVLLLQRQLEKLGQNSSTGGGWEGPGKGI